MAKVAKMTQLIKTYNGLGLVFELNWDRVMYVLMILLCLLVGHYIALLLL